MIVECVEVENKDDVLNAPLGDVLFSMKHIIEEEDLESAAMVIGFVNDEGEGVLFNIDCERVEKKKEKKGFWSRLFG